MSQGKLKSKLNLLDLTLLGVGSIIGSGWLFGALHGAEAAGSLAWLSWIIGAVAIILIGLVYAELGSAIPRAGGFVRYPEYSHGSVTGFLIGFTSFLAYTSVVGVEVEAVRTYASYWWKGLNASNGAPTALGFVVQTVLLVLFFLLNYWSVNFFGKFNTVITFFKFVVPLLTIVAMFVFFKGSNYHLGGAHPGGIKGVFSAVAGAGIVFSYLGFRQAIDFAGEAKNPQKDIPRAIILAVVIGLVLYVLLQIGFVGAVPFDKMGATDWSNLGAKIQSSPYADMMSILGLGWLLQLILWDAVISPAGTGNVFMAGAGRVLYAWAKNGYLPKAFAKVDPKTGIPRAALWLSLVLAFLWTLPAQFQAWGGLINAVTSAFVLTYMVGPVTAGSFRKVAPGLKRPFVLKGFSWISPLAFIAASLIAYWSGYEVMRLLVILNIIAFVVFTLVANKNGTFKEDLKAGWWLIVYYIVMAVISWLGQYGSAPLKAIPQPWDDVLVAVLSLIIYYWGVNSGLKEHRILEEDEVTKKAV